MKKFLAGVLITLGILSLTVWIAREGLAAWSKGYEHQVDRAKLLSEMTTLRISVTEYLNWQGELPGYLSDLGLKISEMTSKNVDQVQIAEGGKIIALLREGEGGWIALVPDVGGLSLDWACTTNVKKYVDLTCSFENEQYTRKKPSFNCANAKTPIENAICDHDRLMHSDNMLVAAYENYLTAAGTDKVEEIRKEQVEWLGQRDDWCTGLSEEKMLLCIDRETIARAESLRDKAKML